MLFAIRVNDVMIIICGVHCCNDGSRVAVSIPGTPLHPSGSSSVQWELSVSGCSPAAVCPPAGAGDCWTGYEEITVTWNPDEQVFPPNAFYTKHTFLFTLLEESSELQTQICNAFKSLVVQLQGELSAGFLHNKQQSFFLCLLSFMFFFFIFTEILNKCKGDLLDMKEGKLKTRPSLLENLILFVEVRLPCFHTSLYISYLHRIWSDLML